MTEEDFLFVWVFDHGANDGGYAFFNCMGDSMFDTTFARIVDECAYSKRVFVMQQCCSGGFIPELQNDNTHIMTAAPDSVIAMWADNESPDGADTLENEYFNGEYYNHGEMDYHMFNAIRLRTIVDNPLPEPDANQNGLTSLKEMWRWVDSTMSDGLIESDPQAWNMGECADSVFLNIPPSKPTGFEGERINNYVHLYWNPNMEYDFDHYNIYKRTYEDSTQTYTDWYLLDQTTDTSYTDLDFAPSNQGADTVWYKIAAVDSAENRSEYSEVLSSPGEIQTQSEGLAMVMLCAGSDLKMEEYPNPANPRSVITYTLPESGITSLAVYDVCGRQVVSLIQDWQLAGSHEIRLDGSDLSSGVYLLRLISTGYIHAQKLVLLK